MLKIIITFISLLICASASGSSPAVFVKGGKEAAWWVVKREIRPIGKTVAGQSIERINAIQSQKVAHEPFCHIEQLTTRSIVSSDRATQYDIDQTLAEGEDGLFNLDFEPEDGKVYSATISAYEKCDGEVGTLVIVINKTTNDIVEINEYMDSLMFLYPFDNDKVGITSCFECGDGTTLHYDVKRKRFYWEYEGD